MAPAFTNNSHFRVILPLLVLAATYFFIDHIIVVTQKNWGIATNLPYMLLVTAFLLASLFKQGRVAMLSIALFLAYIAIQTRLQVPLHTDNKLLELSILTFLLPVAAALVYCFPSEGLRVRHVLLYLTILGLFGFWSYLLLTYFENSAIVTWTKGVLFVRPELSRLPVVLILYCCAVIGVTAILLLRNNRTLEATVYSALLMSTATFMFFEVRFISSTMFTLSALLIIVYLVSASHVLAFMDALTGLAGRRMLDLDVKQLGRTFTIAMLDIDHFKKFNDTYGHATGDDVLKLVAGCLAKRQNHSVRVYRYGGEEFTLLFRNKNAQQAQPILEQLRADIANYNMTIRDADTRPENKTQGKRQRGKTQTPPNRVTITVSIGVCDTLTSHNAEEVKQLADQALYRAKGMGRNRVTLYQA